MGGAASETLPVKITEAPVSPGREPAKNRITMKFEEDPVLRTMESNVSVDSMYIL